MDLFKHYLHLEPAEMQVLTAVFNFPWSIKLLYGIIADNIPIYGSKRKSYIMITGFLELCFLLPLMPNMINNKYLITVFLTLYAINVAFCDAVIDALMVMQSRRDPLKGS